MLSKVISSLFEKILKDITQNDNQISDQSIEMDDFIESLEFIDENCISLFTTSSHLMQVFEVKDNNKSKTKPDRYYCVIDTNYCSCDPFRTGVLNDSVMFCKHLIASKLSKAMNKYITVETTESDIKRLWTKHIIN